MNTVSLRLLLLLIAHIGFSNLIMAQSNITLKKIEATNIFSDADFKSCHASTIVELKNGKIMAAWFAGNYEGSSDVSIWTSVLHKGKWSKAKCIADGIQNDSVRYACWNPVLFLNNSGKLFLFYKVGLSPREWWAEMKTSLDYGDTWSTSIKLPYGFLGPIKNKPLQLPSGDILFPSSTESVSGSSWKIHLEKSNSEALVWEKIEIDNDTFNIIQPTILNYSNGKLQMLCRSKQNVIVETWSLDNGFTWSKARASTLINPNSAIDAASMQNGVQVLAYNPMKAGEEWWHGRSVLTIAISNDGLNWTDKFTLENHKNGEFSYPAMLVDNAGILHVTYTFNRKTIKYACFKIEQ